MKRKKVLIVEDEPIILRALNNDLLKLYDVLAAMDGVSALEVIKEEIPDLILLDIILPYKTGFEVLEEIKQISYLKDIPVIILSSLDSKEDIQKGLALGAIDFMVKPEVSFTDIHKIIADTLKK